MFLASLNSVITLPRTPLESEYPLVFRRLYNDSLATKPLFWTGYKRINNSHFENEAGLVKHYRYIEPVKVSFSTRNATFILNHKGQG